MAAIFVTLLVLLVTFGVSYLALSAALIIGHPDEILVLSGRDHQLPSGQIVGYRTTIAGRVVRIPVLEAVDVMSLAPMRVTVSLRGAYSKGGAPLDVEAAALVAISPAPDVIHNAIERFLGRERQEIARVAEETIEGALRSVLATLTAEEVYQDRSQLTEALARELEPDLDKLGLSLRSFYIMKVRDPSGRMQAALRGASSERGEGTSW